MPLTEAERRALWLQNRARRMAQHGVITAALRGSEAARARIASAWAPFRRDLPPEDDCIDDPQLANWNSG
jgi:hypothetical protein